MNKKPNVLIYMTDQQRGNTVFPYCKAKMPNMEEFAKDATVFSKTYTVSPHCCPARASLFSGLYPSQHGVWNNVNVGNALRRGLYDGVKLFSEDFKEAGYRTYYSGKWHISNYEGPCNRGFDYNSADNKLIYAGVSDNLRPFVKEWKQYETYKEQIEKVEGEILRRGYKTYKHYDTKNELNTDDKIAAHGVYVLKNREEIDKQVGNTESTAPWLQVVSANDPHDPYFVAEKYLDLYDIDEITLPESYSDTMEDKPGLYRKTVERFRQLSDEEHRQSIRHYLAACSHQDDLFGQVITALKESGEYDNTIILYLSDHGDYMGDHGLWCKGLPCFEGAYHIPLMIKLPKGMKQVPQVVTDITAIVDVAPTLMDLCGITYDREMMGQSLVSYIEGNTIENRRTEHYTQSNGNELYGIQRSVWNTKWKYTYNGFDYDEFYDLENDPHEIKNIYNEYKDSKELKEMSKKMWAFAKKTDDVCVNPYIMVGLSSYGPGILFEEDK